MTIQKPTEVLSKAYRRLQIDHASYNHFLDALERYMTDIKADNQVEDGKKSALAKFLNSTFYDNYHVAPTSDNIDLAIHMGKSPESDVAVLFETKETGSPDMVRSDKLNVKAMQQLVFYYLRQRRNGNVNIRHLVATDFVDFFIFDASEFERCLYDDKELVGTFESYADKSLPKSKTDFFYKQIAAPAIAKVQDDIKVTHFSIEHYKGDLKKRAQTGKLPNLYRLLSPTHLLKHKFQNDSNTLNEGFYKELLHLIGLEEVKENNKTVIRRKKEGERNPASLLENALEQLETHEWRRGLDISYGKTHEEKVYNAGMEMCIIWINRLLFLKLLEAQLLNYHKGDTAYRFMTYEKMPDFDKVNSLFFQVMAKQPENRNDKSREIFPNVPYLNSSLFELSEVENKTIQLSNLDNDGKLPLIPKSVLRHDPNFAKKKSLPFLEYLFTFLDAYNFSSEGTGDVAEKPKTLINASVLGLIFEKINGYKDGAVFTPGFITQYMSRQAIRSAVVQKFNDHYGWQLKDFEDIYNQDFDRKEANALINTLTICDPAVGSGHFLVSVLNEIILIKHDLGCLFDTEGKRIKDDYAITIENDELIITDEDGELYSYKPNIPKNRRIQESIFNEKRTLIENCLFGVDINPNSVNICRLRLWIELLKNAYYTAESGFTQLETLPNIDINIKHGNSLLHKFGLTDALNFSDVIRYKKAVRNYKESHSKTDKAELEKVIADSKLRIKGALWYDTPEMKAVKDAQKKVSALKNPQNLFKSDKISKSELKKWQKNLNAAENELEKAYGKLEEAKTKNKYDDGFEWRMEFPEVLDDAGNFIGFDVIIGNPPYIQLQSDNGRLNKILSSLNYKTYFATGDIYCLFYEIGFQLLKNQGVLSFINSNTWLQSISFSPFRKFVTENFKWETVLINSKVFNAEVDTHCVQFRKDAEKSDCSISVIQNNKMVYSHTISKNKISNTDKPINITIPNDQENVVSKIFAASVPLSTIYDIYNGVKPFEKGKGFPPQTSETVKNKPFVSEGQKPDDSWTPLLRGSLIYKYKIKWAENYWIKYGPWLAAPRSKDIFLAKSKIVIRQTGDTLIATIIDDSYICRNNLHICIPKKQEAERIKYVLGIINSKLLDYAYTYLNPEKGEALAEVKKAHVNQLPIRNDENYVPMLSVLVDKILKASPNEDTSELENTIDHMVYHLYGLTYDEVLIIDPATPISRSEYEVFDLTAV